jgi:hypothetical protein
MRPVSPPTPPGYTAKQAQYLAYIHTYRRLHGQPPAEADIQRFFQVSPPSVHQMILKLEQAGLITRQPGVARSITLLIDPKALPELNPRHDQPVKTTVPRDWATFIEMIYCVAQFELRHLFRCANCPAGSDTVVSCLSWTFPP